MMPPKSEASKLKLLRPAENLQAYAKVGILGFAGSGKTFTASQIAIGLAPMTGSKPVAFFDTETGSDFVHPLFKKANVELLVLKARSFSQLLDVTKEAESECSVLIIDSITHVWKELMESYRVKLNRSRLQFQDWATIKAEWSKFTDLFVNGKLHIIICGRAGYEYDYDFNEDGSKDLVKTDVKMKVESEFGFEPSLVISMERITENKEEAGAKKSKAKIKMGSQWTHRAHILKDRTDTINGDTFDNPTFEAFKPHIDKLNIGGKHFGVDTDANSGQLFDNVPGSETEWRKRQTRTEIALETIKNALEKTWPGTSEAMKSAKRTMIEVCFNGTLSWREVETQHLDKLEAVARELKFFAEWAQGQTLGTTKDALGAALNDARKQLEPGPGPKKGAPNPETADLVAAISEYSKDDVSRALETLGTSVGIELMDKADLNSLLKILKG